MREITRENHKEFCRFNGVIAAIPKTNSKYFFLYGYSITDELSRDGGYSLICYNSGEVEDNAIDVSPLKPEFLYSDFDILNYYHFSNFEEFCIWYLQQKNREIWIDGENKARVYNIKPEKPKEPERIKIEKEPKEWIHEKWGTNTPPTSVPEHPSKGNKIVYKTTRKEYYHPILEYIEDYVKLALMSQRFDVPLSAIKCLHDKLEDWLKEEIEVKGDKKCP